jgi:hypothetical protein
MSELALSRWLEDSGAHRDVVEWAARYETDWERAWNECPRGDWLLAVAARQNVERAALVRAACACAELAAEYVPDDEPRPHAALDAAQRWLEGRDDPEARERASADVERAIDEAPDPAVAAAAAAAFAALRAIDSPEDAAMAAASVVQAAVCDAGHCAMTSAMSYAQSTCADRVREHVPFSAIAPR